MTKYLLFTFILPLALVASAQEKNPSFEEVLSLRQAGTPLLSPDGRNLIYSVSATDWKENRYDSEIWISKDGAPPFQLTQTPKGSSFGAAWSPDGKWITFLSGRANKTQLYAIRLAGGEAFPLTQVEGNIRGYEWSPDGKQIALSMTPKEGKKDKKRTEKYGAFAVDDQEFKTTGLYLMDFDPYRPTPVLTYVYPMVQWVNKGALVLRVNYRGSAGYGEAFRSLNVRNLGVGDAWDVLSGVDYLEKKGLIDTDKMGCMGWSQGGYISAFLTTHTDRFKAISVGAGISNWMTYYVNTDIHPFTRQYLQATPWEDEEIYKKTSPMTNINKATTPTLIQHGEFDRRVPVANAYELAQGLRDVGVDTKLIIYKGFGHGITKPKERLAAVVHNWEWFNKYVFGE